MDAILWIKKSKTIDKECRSTNLLITQKVAESWSAPSEVGVVIWGQGTRRYIVWRILKEL